MTSVLPALNVFSRVLFAFAFAFLVPLAWAWSEDHEEYRYVWEGAFALAAGSGWLIAMATRRYRRELQARVEALRPLPPALPEPEAGRPGVQIGARLS